MTALSLKLNVYNNIVSYHMPITMYNIFVIKKINNQVHFLKNEPARVKFTHKIDS